MCKDQDYISRCIIQARFEGRGLSVPRHRFPNPQLYKALGFPRRGKPRIYNGVLVRQTARFLEGCSGLGYSANPGLIVFIQVTDTTLPILAMVVWLDFRN